MSTASLPDSTIDADRERRHLTAALNRTNDAEFTISTDGDFETLTISDAWLPEQVGGTVLSRVAMALRSYADAIEAIERGAA